jgi:uncharacterized membrane protein
MNKFSAIIISFIISFLMVCLAVAFWYGVGYLLSNDSNPLHWNIYGKVFLVLMGAGVVSAFFKFFNEIYNDLIK